jgi:hypothetical protein
VTRSPSGSSLLHHLEFTSDSTESIGKRDNAGCLDPHGLPVHREAILPADLPCIEEIQLRSVTSKFVLFTRDWLEGSGVGNTRFSRGHGFEPIDTTLFIRERCVEQLKFILGVVEMKHTLGVVLGAPGTGKSTTAYLCAGLLASHMGRIVFWIHLEKEKRVAIFCKCVIMLGNKSVRFSVRSSQELERVLNGNWGAGNDDSERIKVVFLDGYANLEFMHGTLAVAKEWLKRRPSHHRLVIVSSTGCMEFVLNELTFKVKIFQQYSWRYEEYIEALANADFRASLAGKLNTVENTETEAIEKVRKKFYYAGGSARFMFQYTTEELVEFIDRVMGCQSNIVELIELTRGNWTSDLRDTLISCYPVLQTFFITGNKEPRKLFNNRELVCGYVKHLIGDVVELETLLQQARWFHKNQAMLGWIFEEVFFKSLWIAPTGKLQLESPDNDGEITILKSGSQPFWSFDPDKPTVADCPSYEWLRPKKYNQGGFDAVYLKPTHEASREGTAMFIQCTIAWSHDAKLRFCGKFIEAARSSG